MLFIINMFLWLIMLKMFLVLSMVVWVVKSVNVFFKKIVKMIRINMFCFGLFVKVCIEVRMLDCIINVLIRLNLKVRIVKRMV